MTSWNTGVPWFVEANVFKSHPTSSSVSPFCVSSLPVSIPTSILPYQSFNLVIVFVVQSISHAGLFETPRTAACQAPLSSTISRSLLKFMSIESMMLSNHLIFCCTLLLLPSIFPSIGAFYNEFLFASGGQKIGASASTSVLPVNIKGWFPLGLTCLIFLLSKGLSRVLSSTTDWNHQFFTAKPSLWSNSHIHAWLLCYLLLLLLSRFSHVWFCVTA